MVVYATLFGTTARIADLVAEELSALLGEDVPVRDLADCDAGDLQGRELVVVGTSTWNFGELPPDLEARLPELEALDLRGTALALFGVGDQLGYPDTFLDAVGVLADRLERTGARPVGRWPASGYAFAASLALRGDELLGLAVDEDNEPELTAPRVVAWVDRVVAESGLASAAGLGRAPGASAGTPADDEARGHAPAPGETATRGAPGLPGAPVALQRCR